MKDFPGLLSLRLSTESLFLAHAHEVMDLNDRFGLGDESAEGLEALNNQIRRMREHGSSKDSSKKKIGTLSITSGPEVLWYRSRPTIVEMERKINKKPKIIISAEPWSRRFFSQE